MKSIDSHPSGLDKAAWLSRCAARYQVIRGLNAVDAKVCAEHCWDTWEGAAEREPEAVADEDMANWE